MNEVFRPMLLLSMPQLQDPNFSRTVVLLSDFNGEGAFGLVLNRPAGVAARDVIQLGSPRKRSNDLPLFVGGPVVPEHGWILVDSPPADVEYRTILAGVYLSSSPDLLRRVIETHPTPRARILAGHAGWGPGQLEGELAQSSWLMCDVEADLVWNDDPGGIWETAIRRMGADPSTLHAGHGIQ